MANSWHVRNRRDEFAGETFDEMIGSIIDLEDELELSRDKIADLEEQIQKLEADA